MLGILPPYIDEHPVALAIIRFSPNNCVRIFIYAVSPQPAHAPGKQNLDCLNCEPFTVYLLKIGLYVMFLSK